MLALYHILCNNTMPFVGNFMTEQADSPAGEEGGSARPEVEEEDDDYGDRLGGDDAGGVDGDLKAIRGEHGYDRENPVRP